MQAKSLNHAVLRVALIVLLISFVLGIKTPANMQSKPEVVLAVAPVYPIAIRGTSGQFDVSGMVQVEIEITAIGNVSLAKAVNGHPILQRSAVEAAKGWRFAPTSDGSVQKVMLTFVYHTMPKGTPVAKLGSIFKPPYKVEVSQISVERSRTSHWR